VPGQVIVLADTGDLPRVESVDGIPNRAHSTLPIAPVEWAFVDTVLNISTTSLCLAHFPDDVELGTMNPIPGEKAGIQFN
jgi:hypothetical protein